MPVFNARTVSEILDSTRRLVEMFFSRTNLVLTPEEFVSAFVYPDHIDKLREVQDLVGFVGQSSLNTRLESSKGFRYAAHIGFVGPAPIIIPQYARQGLSPHCPDDVRAKITAWADERARFGEAFGDALDAVHYLSDTCGDAPAMRVVLPCLPTLMAAMASDSDERTINRAKKVTESKKFGYLPRLPQAAKQRLLDISAMINSAALVKDAPMPEVRPQHGLLQVTGMASGEPARINVFYQNAEPNTAVPTATFV